MTSKAEPASAVHCLGTAALACAWCTAAVNGDCRCTSIRFTLRLHLCLRLHRRHRLFRRLYIQLEWPLPLLAGGHG